MTLSPIAEELLFRGLVFSGIRSRWGDRTAAVVQATAFALAHLANYGLVPFQPLLDLFWLPSMFVAATAFQYVAVRSRSLWPPILAHCAYNLGMTTMAFVLLG
jgi:membrane protease YdiL (CAAX protease family)